MIDLTELARRLKAEKSFTNERAIVLLSHALDVINLATDEATGIFSDLPGGKNRAEVASSLQSMINGARALPAKDAFPWPDMLRAEVQKAAVESNRVGEGNATLARARELLWSDLEQGVKDLGAGVAFGFGSIAALAALAAGLYFVAIMPRPARDRGEGA